MFVCALIFLTGLNICLSCLVQSWQVSCSIHEYEQHKTEVFRMIGVFSFAVFSLLEWLGGVKLILSCDHVIRCVVAFNGWKLPGDITETPARELEDLTDTNA